MNTEQKQVRDFMLAAQQELPPIPTIPSLGVRILRAALMLEEAIETIRDGLGLDLCIRTMAGKDRCSLGEVDDAARSDKWFDIGPGNLIQIADGCADLKVVTDGCALACGIDLEPVMAEVSRSNMSKFIDGHRREDGKFCKGPSYSPADIGPILEAQKTPQEPVLAVQTPLEPSKGPQWAPSAEFGPILDPRQTGEELVCEYRGFQITRFRPNGFPVLHYFNGELEHGLATNLGGDETILRVIKDGIDEFRYAEEQKAKLGSGMAVEREVPWIGAIPSLYDGGHRGLDWHFGPYTERLLKMPLTQLCKCGCERQCHGHYLGCLGLSNCSSTKHRCTRFIPAIDEQDDPFRTNPLELELKILRVKLARADALAVAARRVCRVNEVATITQWESVIALQSALTAYETGGEA